MAARQETSNALAALEQLAGLAQGANPGFLRFVYCSIRPHPWSISLAPRVRTSVLDGRFLSAPIGYGVTPEAAAADLFRGLTELAEGEYVVIDQFGVHGTRRRVDWDGSAWAVRDEAEASL